MFLALVNAALERLEGRGEPACFYQPYLVKTSRVCGSSCSESCVQFSPHRADLALSRDDEPGRITRSFLVGEFYPHNSPTG
ncbi:hypothetical protein ElyMa_002485100 [Elysia marginata]|uniref:Uncharacterized protein n=1 Tax=Elysia marginata TaxID=1093978 RepID=A0AAV4GRX9_9GAST|nr:hypothetical protein ElyMa_002485100 [Elysia marginata]